MKFSAAARWPGIGRCVLFFTTLMAVMACGGDNRQQPTLGKALAGTLESPLTPHEVDRLVSLTTQWEYHQQQQRLQKYPDGATITVALSGDPTPNDRATVQQLITELAALTRLVFVESTDAASADIRIHFEPMAMFSTLLPNYVAGNSGFFSTNAYYYTITGATLLINSDRDDTARNHLLREELSQSLGLYNDLPDDETSIFYSLWSDTDAFNESDKRMLAALYTTGLTAGLRAEQMRLFFE